jgi:hypothetical protein
MILDGQRRSLLGKPIRQGTGWGPAALQRYSDGDEPLHHQQRGQGMLAALVTAFGVTILLVGTALAIVATLKAASQVPWAALAVAVYGALPRPLPTWVLLGLPGLAAIPAALAHEWHGCTWSVSGGADHRADSFHGG